MAVEKLVFGSLHVHRVHPVPLRALLLPPGGPASIPLWINLLALSGSIVLFGLIGIKGFHRRAQD